MNLKNEIKITYHVENGFNYPDLELPNKEQYPIGKYGMLHLEHLKKHRKGTYTTLLSEGVLNEYLYDIDSQARELIEIYIAKMAEKLSINEELKAKNQLEWVRQMNNINHASKEIYLRR